MPSATAPPTLSDHMTRNGEALMALREVSAKARRALLGKLRGDVVESLVELAQNIIIGNVSLTRAQFDALNKHRELLHDLAKKRQSVGRSVRVLQEGDGLLSSLLGPLVNILGGVFGGGGKARA
jgi:hypothetical protein